MRLICGFLLMLLSAASVLAAETGSGSFSALANAQQGQVNVLRAHETARPRSFADSKEWGGIRYALLNGDRREAFDVFLKRLSPYLNSGEIRTLPMVESSRGNQVKALGELATKKEVDTAKWRAQALAFAALVTANQQYVVAAKRHMLALAELDSKGSSGVEQEDLSARHIAWTLALGIDWLYPFWTKDEKNKLISAISVRMEDFSYQLVSGSTPLEKFPLNSHGNEVLGALAEIGVLLAGETRLADKWMREFIPLYTRLLSPFGGNDGGYSNGTSYAVWDLHEYGLRHWDTLRRVLGIDLALKPWAKNFGAYLLYFVPPGTPVGNFGDGAEQNLAPTWALTAKAYASRAPSQLHRWYAAQWFQEDKSALDILLMPTTAPGGEPFPEATSNSVYLQDIGQVAMHSSIRDRARTSIYFRSSRYGSISHAHSDQNSFTLNSAGVPLLIDSGYYDFFGSPHHYGWTKRSVAHNVVTFDGGNGQDDPARPQGDDRANGKVIQFSTSPEVDLTTGDATNAYRGQLKVARRGIAYLRPDIVIVFDLVASDIPRIWEWNLHARSKFNATADAKTISTDAAGTTACITFHANSETQFRQTDRFSFAPTRTQVTPRPNQWHGQFVTDGKIKGFRAAAVIAVNCTPVTHTVEFRTTDTRVRIGGRLVSFDGQRVHVADKEPNE